MNKIKFDEDGKIILKKINYEIEHKEHINDLINEIKKIKKK